MTPDDIKASDNYIFYRVTMGGHLDMCRWLAYVGWITPAEIMANHSRWALIIGNNGVEFTKWLVTFARMTPDEVKMDNYRAFKYAINRKTLDTLSWLADYVQLTPREGMAIYNDTRLDLSHFNRATAAKEWMNERWPGAIKWN